MDRIEVVINHLTTIRSLLTALNEKVDGPDYTREGLREWAKETATEVGKMLPSDRGKKYIKELEFLASQPYERLDHEVNNYRQFLLLILSKEIESLSIDGSNYILPGTAPVAQGD